MEEQSIAESPIATRAAGEVCSNCGGKSVHGRQVRSAFWHDERLVVIDDIPALVCESCGEQYYDDGTAIVLDLLRGDGFPPEQAKSELVVSVFSLRDRLSPRSAG
jgi:YgiT-type zinc finger domain-containing protein